MRYRFTIPRPPNWPRAKVLLLNLCLIGGGLAVAGAVFIMSFLLAMRSEMRSSEVEVPALAGMTLEEADLLAKPDGLLLQVVDQRHDPATASGRVIQQVPPAGTKVRRGRKLKLILSLGGRVLEVPRTVGQAARTVSIELRRAGFVPGDEARAYSPAVGQGLVMAQVPPADTPAVPSTRVHRLVSNGPVPRSWVMPDLGGLDRRAAERWIEAHGFRKGAIRRVNMSGRIPETVIGQLPLAGYPVKDTDVVELTIAR